MMTKRKKRVLKNLGTLLAISNDYIYDKHDINIVANLAADIAWDLGKKKGSDLMISYANEAYRAFKIAENSDPNVEGGSKNEETKTI